MTRWPGWRRAWKGATRRRGNTVRPHMPSGAATGWHRHQYPYVVVPMTTGRLAITGPGGPTAADLVAGRSYARPAGVEHDVRNANAFEFIFVEVEIKERR